MKKFKIVLVRKFKTVQIEFPIGLAGVRDGVLHLALRHYADVSGEELAYIKNARPEIFDALKVVEPVLVSSRTARRLNAAKAAADKAKAPGAPSPTEKTKPRKRKSK